MAVSRLATVPPNRLRLLLIEDDKGRADKIRFWLPDDVLLTHAASAGRAIGILQRDRGAVYAGILLDHDLQGSIASEMDEYLSGADVTKVIIHYVDPDVPILVHSMNPAGAHKMGSMLREAGFDVTWIAMVALDQKKLNEWVVEVRERWRDRTEE